MEFGSVAIPLGACVCLSRDHAYEDLEQRAVEYAYQTLERAGCPRPSIVLDRERMYAGCEIWEKAHDHLHFSGECLVTDAPPRDSLTAALDRLGTTAYDFAQFGLVA